MNRKFDENEFIIRERGPIWSIKVGVYSHLLEGSRVRKVETRRWKIKEILN